MIKADHLLVSFMDAVLCLRISTHTDLAFLLTISITTYDTSRKKLSLIQFIPLRVAEDGPCCPTLQMSLVQIQQ